MGVISKLMEVNIKRVNELGYRQAPICSGPRIRNSLTYLLPRLGLYGIGHNTVFHCHMIVTGSVGRRRRRSHKVRQSYISRTCWI